MKKSVLILMAGLSLLSLASCSKKDDGDANALKIALVPILELSTITTSMRLHGML